jgi:hypothetical protein
LGKPIHSVQVDLMSTDSGPKRDPQEIAEEVLRTIYGDDFKGCTVTLDQIAAIVAGAEQQQTETIELVDLYEKVIEALHLLSTPPDPQTVDDAKRLNDLLSQRLDAIHAVTTRTRQTTTLVKRQNGSRPDPS